MLSYSLKRRKNKGSKNPKFVRNKTRRKMLLSKCAVCNNIKLKFLKEQEVRGLLSDFRGMKIPILSDLPIFK